MVDEEPAPKKARVDGDNSDNDLLDQVWQHYRDYLDSVPDNYEDGDIDELQEILEIVSKNNVNHLPTETTLENIEVTRTCLLPVLISVAHGILANQATAQRVANKDEDNSELNSELERSIQMHTTASLKAFSDNALVWSQLANVCRMQLLDVAKQPLAKVVEAYQKAAKAAHAVRNKAIALLDAAPGKDDDKEAKEWIELLLVNQVCGVEWEVDEEHDEGKDATDEKKDEDLQGQQESDEEEDGYWSTSAVEGTSRFMAAMMLSTLGEHDAAREHLQHFDLTHRLHPNVWTGKADEKPSQQEKDLVVAYRGGVLPQPLYERLCAVFGPDAIYWKESDYANRGYYSYFLDHIHDEKPKNVLEEVIFQHMLPLAQAQTEETIVGAEWWVHTRPIQANLGHNMHFDTDESLLSSDKEITHPVISSVLYLTGDSLGGATIVLDQTPQCEELPESAWRSVPSNNSYLLFPGNRLHGVLPCPGKPASEEVKKTEGSLSVQELFAGANKKDTSPTPHRLTLLVGFWTRRVPDKMKEQKLYGPCGPMPDGEKWMDEVSDGYGDSFQPTERTNLNAASVTKVSPAWESLKGTKPEDALMMPRGIDHRFFVKGAPRCFHDSLFERDEYDDPEDEEEDQEE